jgi:SAM-dependent methyltransferase
LPETILTAQSEQDRFGSYFAYLRKRSRTGYLYRRFWLYPALKRQLSGRVLDVGCGIGDFLASTPGSTGVDINPFSVHWCRKRGLNADVMEEGKIPFPDRSFESAVLDNVLEHIEDPRPLLAEVHRILRPSGIFVVGVPGPRGFAADPDHKIFYDETTLTNVVTRAGFVLLKVHHLPLRSSWLRRRLRQYCLYGVFRHEAVHARSG